MTSDSRQTMQEKIRLTVDEETERVLHRILDGIEDRFAQLDEFQQFLEKMINQINNLDDTSNILRVFGDSLEKRIDSLKEVTKVSLDKLESEFSRINSSIEKTRAEVDGSRQDTGNSISGISEQLNTARTEFANTFILSANEFKTFREKQTSNQELLENIDEAISVLLEVMANHNNNTEDRLKSNGDLVSNVQKRLNELDTNINFKNDDIQEKLKKVEEKQIDLKSITSALSDKLALMKSTLDFIALPWWKRIFGRNK